MMKAHHEDTDASNQEAEHTARILLKNWDLPLLIRAQACIIIGCGISSDFLDWARESVRIAELRCSVASKVGPVEAELLENRRYVLKIGAIR